MFYFAGDSEVGRDTAEVQKVLESAKNGDHYVVVYPDLQSFRGLYVNYIKSRLDKNEIVVLLPYYETTDKSRSVLSQGGINVWLEESRGFLALMDSYKMYLGFQQDRDLFFKRLVSHALLCNKSGIAIIADMGAYFLIDQLSELVKYNVQSGPHASLPIRGLCCYHQKDFENLSESQKKSLFTENYKALILRKTS